MTLTDTSTSATSGSADATTEHLLAVVDELGPRFRSRMRDLDRTSTFPFENFAEATAAGLNRLCVPVEDGGFGYWLPGNFSGLYRIRFRFVVEVVDGWRGERHHPGEWTRLEAVQFDAGAQVPFEAPVHAI